MKDYYQISTEQHEYYNQNGYLLLKKLIPEDVCEELIRESDEFAKGLYTNYLQMHKYKTFQKIHTGKLLCSLGDQIIGSKAIPVGSGFFYCKPGNFKNEHGSTWHQDNYAAKAPIGAYLNIAVSLDEADKDNGSLFVVPGSHKLGDLPCNPKANFTNDAEGNLVCFTRIGSNTEVPQDSNIIQLEYQRGDVLLVHANLLHKAEQNRHPTRWRRTMYFCYIKEEAPFWPGWNAKRELLERFDSEKYQK
jgi:hypothetical protein